MYVFRSFTYKNYIKRLAFCFREKLQFEKAFASSAYKQIQTNQSQTKSPCQAKFTVPEADLLTVSFQQTNESDAQFHRAVMGKFKKFHRFIL